MQSKAQSKASSALVFEQRSLQAGGAWIEIRLAQDARGLHYRLAYGRDGDCLLCYENRPPSGHLRTLRGRAVPYAFRSVEQLRYDFERDAEAL